MKKTHIVLFDYNSKWFIYKTRPERRLFSKLHIFIIYSYTCINISMQWRRATQFLEKYTSHFIWKVCVWEGAGDRTELQHIDPHSIGHQRFFPVLLGCSIEGLGAQPLWVLVFSTASYLHSSDPQLSIGGLRAPSAGCWLSLLRLVSNWSGLQTALSYIIVQRPPSCGRQKLHSFNPSTVKATLCYSMTGCTCYLHRCISYFDSPAES